MDAWMDRIAVNPKVMGGKPVIRGSRVTVERVLYLLGEGLTPDQVLQEHPHVTAEDVRACLLYASQLAGSEDVIPLPERRPA